MGEMSKPNKLYTAVQEDTQILRYSGDDSRSTRGRGGTVNGFVACVKADLEKRLNIELIFFLQGIIGLKNI